MGYDLYDFTHSLEAVSIPITRMEHCSLGFGYSPEGYGSWTGGFVCHTRSGAPWVLVCGWCDTTGWGCQDGAQAFEFDHEPTAEEVREAFIGYCGEWSAEALDDPDVDPADLNRMLRGEIDQWGNAS